MTDESGPRRAPRFERGMKGPERLRLCRQLREQQTPPEQMLWELLRDRRFEGYKFRRQQPLGNFVADFYCSASQLAVELDGGVHDTQRERDRARDAILAAHGVQVLRIHNAELIAEAEAVLDRLRLALQSSVAPHPPTSSLK